MAEEVHENHVKFESARRTSSCSSRRTLSMRSQLLHEQLLKQKVDLREAHENSLKELKKFQGSIFDTIAVRRLVEDQDTILELIAKTQELQKMKLIV